MFFLKMNYSEKNTLNAPSRTSTTPYIPTLKKLKSPNVSVFTKVSHMRGIVQDSSRKIYIRALQENWALETSPKRLYFWRKLLAFQKANSETLGACSSLWRNVYEEEDD